ncbi:protein translocase subunit SecD [Angustibacter peucedani]
MSRRAPVVRLLVVLGVLLASATVALGLEPRLGLDLRGGTQIVLEAQDTPTTKADAAATDKALEVLRRRVDALGVAEPSLARSGENRVVVELPGLQDPAEAAQVIGRTAQLTFHPVTTQPGEGVRETVDEDGAPLLVGPTALTGEGVKGADAGTDPSQGLGWFVTVDFTGPGGDAWQRLTGQAACAAPGDPARRIAIVLDDAVISSPQVDPGVGCEAGIPGGTTQITGQFTSQQARDLAALVEGGALPLPVEIVEQRTVGPTLGADAVDASWKAALLGVSVTALFIVLVYRLVGLMATVALAAYALISYAALVALGATLTLPGLAGFVLAIGMAVDANVLVFERAREELAEGARSGPDVGGGLRGALSRGFSKAWSAILDANVTTLLAAGLLFFLASGPVRGFGVTLTIGVLASLVSALLVTRVLAEWAVQRRAVVRRPGWSGLAATGRVRDWLERRRPDLMSRRRLWLACSGGLVVLALAGIGARGLDLGVEFTGGRLVEVSTTQPVGVDVARQAVSDAGFARAVVQESGDGDLTVRDAGLDDAEVASIRAALAEVGGGTEVLRDELIGPSLGEELRTKALVALGIALAVQLLYLSVRFRWTFAVAAVVAMFQDLVVVVGLFAWLGRPADGVFLAALLTVIGYSVNDTVVVFDRVREHRARFARRPFAEVANDAVLQTVPRTVNTGIGAIAILAALALLGGDSLTDFALALLVGIVAGTASTVFTATPVAVLLQARWPGPAPRSVESERAARAARARRDPRDSGAVV